MSGLVLLHEPHHDGSSRYVSQPFPRLGDPVDVSVRVPHAARVRTVHVRALRDAEPVFTAAEAIRETESDTWWRARITVANPVTNYRFLLLGGSPEYQWLNGTGVHDHDVPDAADFRLTTYASAPQWALDAVVYQVFPDRFARSDAAAGREPPEWAVPADWAAPFTLTKGQVGTQFFGGDLDGVTEHLDHVEKLGATALYLTPVFPARSNHRYDAATFDRVDEALGGDAAYARLVDAVHARGMRILGDLTTNHTGATHEWFLRARQDPACEERGYYFFDGDAYAAWLGVTSLPKLNYDSPNLLSRLCDRPTSPVRRWLSGPHALDGWRIDVANMTGRFGDQDRNAEIARHVRAAMTEVNADSYLVAEHGHDHSGDLAGDGWHGVMNYAGFTRPLWTWLRHTAHAPSFLGLPAPVPRLPGPAVLATMREFNAIVPWQVRRQSLNLVGSHDTTRIRTLVGGDTGLIAVALAMQLTMPGIPMITYGDEVGMPGDFGEDGRRPMPWEAGDGDDRWDEDLLAAYRDLISLRRNNIALVSGGLRWVCADDDALVYLREHPDQSALVHLARATHPAVRLPVAAFDGISRARVAHGGPLTIDSGDVVIDADRPTVEVWTWAPND